MPSVNMTSYYPPQQPFLPAAYYPAYMPVQRQAYMPFQQVQSQPPYRPQYAQQPPLARQAQQQPVPQVVYVPVYTPDTFQHPDKQSESITNTPSTPAEATSNSLLDKTSKAKLSDVKSEVKKEEKSEKAAENALARIIMQYAKTNPALRALMTTDNILQLEKSLKDPTASVGDLLEKFIKVPLQQELHAKGITGFFRRQSARTVLYSAKRFLKRIPMTQNYRDQLNQFFDDLKKPVGKTEDKHASDKLLAA